MGINLVGMRILASLVPVGFADLPLLAISGLLLIWQFVGGWRLAGRVMRESGDLAISVAIYAGIVVVIILTFVQAIDRISQKYLLPLDLGDLEIKLFETQEDGRVIVVSGAISFGINTSLKETIVAYPNARTVLLDSEGGNIFAGRALAFTIAEHALATRVDGKCFSACTLAFIAGSPRVLGPDGRLGFHGYAFDSSMRVQTLNVDEQEAIDRAFFASQGVSDDFINGVFSTPPSELWQPSRQELRQSGVIAD